MTRFQGLIGSLLLLVLPCLGHTKEQEAIRVGFELNRYPMAYIDKFGRPQGIIINRMNQICEQANLDCKWVSGHFNLLLKQLENAELDAVVNIDQAHLPQHFLRETSAICQPEVLLVHPVGTLPNDELSGYRVGVQQGSWLQNYLIQTDELELDSYLILESAVVDLFFERLDLLVVSRAFYQSRIERLQRPPLAPRWSTKKMTYDVSKTQGTSLVFLESNIEKFALFTLLLSQKEGDKYCYEYLGK